MTSPSKRGRRLLLNFRIDQRLEAARLVAEEYVNDLQEIMKKLRGRLN